jgi:effector-binding domain-containing protein
MNYEVRQIDVVERPTAVIEATTTWGQFPTVWSELLNEVWTCLRAGGITSGCRNVMLYLDNLPNVEVGVQLAEPCPLTGRVTTSVLPAGRVAMTTHRGSYAELGNAHRAILDWCATSGEHTTGTRWEIYGPHNDDVAQTWTEIYYLLA